eukprot:m.35340 g.35340  ORF g.35340 m.35340 type:complete len:376 (-) comp17117_c0_seq1:56-1183(-)
MASSDSKCTVFALVVFVSSLFVGTFSSSIKGETLTSAAVAAADDVWPNACVSQPGYNQTRCPASATCCASEFSASHQGCCPWPDAVCCPNKLTCCPDGTMCVDTIPHGWPSWGAVTTCTTPTKSKTVDPPALGVTGKCVCKPGAPLPMSTTLKNVLIIGDSVSLGYTPSVAEILGDVALVQHAPWGGDGGAEETAYGMQCLDYWLRSPAGLAIKPDLVYFNFGLHDGPQLFNEPPANVTIPGQEGNMTVYPGELKQIAMALKNWSSADGAGAGAKLLFAITSPMMAAARPDEDVVNLNTAAKQVMASVGIPTVDLYAAIVKECGPVPQSSCFGIPDCFSPHCGGTATHIPGQPTKGYYWLANSTIAPAIKQELGL